MSTTTIFLKNVTCLDHAWCSITKPIPVLGEPTEEDYRIQGGSFMVSVLVTGEVTEDEHVVVDFSTIKKDIKSIIDHPTTGLDHKLWVFPGMFTSERSSEPEEIPYVTLRNPYTKVRLPSSDAAFVGAILSKGLPYSNSAYLEYSTATATKIVQTLLQTELDLKYPGIKVEVLLSEEPDFLEIPGMARAAIKFRYVHGLKDSTSLGCQNIAHGHLSYLAAYYSEEVSSQNRPSPEFLVSSGILDNLAGKVLIYEDNIKNEDTCAYSVPRGDFSMSIGSNYQYALFPVETTIENILDCILTPEIKVLMLEKGVSYVAVSEGLQKGSIVKL